MMGPCMSDDAGKAMSIFLSAVENHAPEQWGTFLDDVCPDDIELRRRVELLLSAHLGDDSFLDRGEEDDAAKATAHRPIREQPGTQIGPYRLLQQLGEGGMGLVYLAQQMEPVKRRVALKIIKPGMDTRQVVARFEAERQALAVMDHPNIAQVLDAGATDSGQPYFVMELVRGVPIAEYCDKENLTTRERLEVFVDVCCAIQHAHQKGVIHRDLKPSNVLITLHENRPVAKVIDFGVSKAVNQQLTEKTLFTAYGQMIGTPQYMSPEQAEMSGLDIDARSDIYSLGVMLYELMTGTTPLDAQRLRSLGYAEMQRVICEEEPPRPSTRISTMGKEATDLAGHRRVGAKQLCDQLAGELDWIVMKALEKDRSRRYGTANAFALDVERYLKNEPVEACPPSAMYRLRKFTTRNKVVVSILTSVALLLVAVTVLNLSLAAWAKHAEKLAEQRRTRETEARTEAERARKNEAALRATAEDDRDKAKEAEIEVEEQRVVAQAAEEKARSNFEQAKRAVDDYLQTVSESDVLLRPGMSPLRRQLLESARVFYQTLLEGQAAEQLDQRDVATARFRLGVILRELQERDAAEQQFAEARPVYTRLLEKFPDDSELQQELVEIIFRLGDPAKAQQTCLAMLEKWPDNRAVRRAAARYYRLHGDQLVLSGRLETAAIQYQEAEKIQTPLISVEPPNDMDLSDLSKLHYAVAKVLLLQERFDNALQRLRLGVAAAERARAAAPDKPRIGLLVASGVRNQARVQRQTGRAEDARRSYQQAISLWSKMVFEYPSHPEFKAELARLYLELADYESLQGNTKDATRYQFRLEQFLSQLPKRLPSDHYQVAVSLAQLARPASSSEPPLSDDAGEQQIRFSDRAVESLSLALANGYLHDIPFDQDVLLQPLIEREDFHSLLDVQAKANQGEKLGRTEVTRLPHRLLMIATLRGIACAHQALGQLELASETFRRCFAELDDEQVRGVAEASAIGVERGKTFYRLGHLHWEMERFRDAHQAWHRGFELLRQAHDLTKEDAKQQLAYTIASEEWQLAEVYGYIAFWDEAARHHSNYVRFGRFMDGNSEARLAVITLVSEEGESYNDACRYVWENFAENEPSKVALLLALGENDVLPSGKIVELAEQDFRVGANFIAQVALGLAHLQNNDPDAALENLPLDYAWRIITEFDRARALSMKGDDEAAVFWMQLGENAYAEIAHRWLTSTTLRSPEAFLQGWWSWELATLQASRRRAWELIHNGTAPDAWAHLFQARGYALIGDMQKSEAAFAAALEVEPENPRLLIATAEVRALLGQHEEAKQFFARALELAPETPEWWIARGKYYLELGKDKLADADMLHAANLSDDDLDLFLRSGWWAVGPFPNDTKTAFLQPDSAHPSRLVARGESISSDNLAPLRWIRIPPDRDDGMVTGRVHLEPVQKEPDQENVSAYALAFVYSPDARTTTLCVASQYMWGAGKPEREVQLRVWFNEQSVFGWVKPKYANLMDFDRIPVQLKPGRNTILVRVSSPKRIGFRMRLSDGPGEKALLAASLLDWQSAADSLRRIPQSKLVRLGSHWSLYCSCLAAMNDPGYAEAVKATTNYYRYATAEKSLGMFLEAATQRASEAMDQEQLAQTIKNLKAPKPKWIQRQVGRALFRAEQYQQAIDWHRTHSLTGLEPDCTVAMALHRLGQQEEAGKILREAKVREFSQLSELKLPQWFTGYVLLREANELITGESLDDDSGWRSTREKLDRAVATAKPETSAYDLALLLQPREPRLWVCRAERYADLAHWAEAERDFDKAVAVGRKSLHTWLSLARYWSRRDNLEQSRKAYSKLLNLDHAGTLRTEVLNDLEQNDRLFVALLELRKRDIPLWRARGTSLCKHGRWNDAILIWKHLQVLMPNDWQLHRDLAMLYAGAGDQPGFAHACEGMMAGPEDAVPPPLTSWYASIMPGSGIEPDAVVSLSPEIFGHKSN